MIAIDWVFIGGAGSIVGVALIERLADDLGYGWVGRIVRALLPVVGIVSSLALFDVIWEVFLR